MRKIELPRAIVGSNKPNEDAENEDSRREEEKSSNSSFEQGIPTRIHHPGGTNGLRREKKGKNPHLRRPYLLSPPASSPPPRPSRGNQLSPRFPASRARKLAESRSHSQAPLVNRGPAVGEQRLGNHVRDSTTSFPAISGGEIAILYFSWGKHNNTTPPPPHALHSRAGPAQPRGFRASARSAEDDSQSQKQGSGSILQ